MKKHSIFPGMILIGFGTYFLLQHLNIALFPGIFSWGTMAMIIGITLLVQAYSLNDDSHILPGVILTGFGFHFHELNSLPIWPEHRGMLVLIVAVGFILRSLKTKADHGQGFLLLAIALLILNYTSFISYVSSLGSFVGAVIKYWPIILIGVGFYLLFVKKK
ncbi:hypothetical protein [Litchfieldia alkalitelluris]|uniref:hypothetical protein n=1 Tax=Litchfieldia alkalitelluris TaxID=304268 RepID=UPI00099639F9|nr:hypothetical protein [Litchfieldia alkalitelluris]